jgi:hypothetical protein
MTRKNLYHGDKFKTTTILSTVSGAGGSMSIHISVLLQILVASCIGHYCATAFVAHSPRTMAGHYNSVYSDRAFTSASLFMASPSQSSSSSGGTGGSNSTSASSSTNSVFNMTMPSISMKEQSNKIMEQAGVVKNDQGSSVMAKTEHKPSSSKPFGSAKDPNAKSSASAAAVTVLLDDKDDIIKDKSITTADKMKKKKEATLAKKKKETAPTTTATTEAALPTPLKKETRNNKNKEEALSFDVKTAKVVPVSKTTLVTNKSPNNKPTTTTPNMVKTKTVSILVCPAQFCVPVDYDDLLDNLEHFFEEGDGDDDDNDESSSSQSQSSHNFKLGSLKVVPLPRTEWIKVAQSLPTKAYMEGTLKGRTTLNWYYQAIEDAIAEILQEQGENIHDNKESSSNNNDNNNDNNSHSICIIGHSIGGWVARGWLGGLGYTSTAIHRRALERVSSLITIGTPHASPPDALVDQTRGLLAEVAAAPTCTSDYLVNDANIALTTVCSGSIQSRLFTTDVKKLLGTFSYVPQAGLHNGLNARGDGIVPLELGLMEEPANRVVVETAGDTDSPIWHAHVLPTPWSLLNPSAASLKLPQDVLWYGSRDVLREWAPYIQ